MSVSSTWGSSLSRVSELFDEEEKKVSTEEKKEEEITPNPYLKFINRTSSMNNGRLYTLLEEAPKDLEKGVKNTIRDGNCCLFTRSKKAINGRNSCGKFIQTFFLRL